MNGKIVAMIPARMGSRRVPNKNIRYMCGKPLINYPIEMAVDSNLFDEIWVNTESDKLGKYCENFGIGFHKRPSELANDKATNRDFVYEFLKTHDCEYVVMINPTSPALKKETVSEFIRFVKENDFDTVMSVVNVKAEALCRGEKINFDGKDKIPSEKLDEISYIVWAMTCWKRDTFINLQDTGNCPVFGENIGYFEIPKDEATDIDTEEDWRIAEAIITARNKPIEKEYLELS